MPRDRRLPGHPAAPTPPAALDPSHARAVATEIGVRRGTRLVELRMALGIGPSQTLCGPPKFRPGFSGNVRRPRR